MWRIMNLVSNICGGFRYWVHHNNNKYFNRINNNNIIITKTIISKIPYGTYSNDKLITINFF